LPRLGSVDQRWMSQTLAAGIAAWMLVGLTFELPPSSDDVLEMMAKVPPAGAYVRTGHARQIAEAIADHATALEGLSLRETEALLVVYAARESANTLCVKGDGGRSLGTFQLQGVSEGVACDPAQAVTAWLGRASASIALCASNAPEERLAALASGSCDHGRLVARARMLLARQIASRDAGDALPLE